MTPPTLADPLDPAAGASVDAGDASEAGDDLPSLGPKTPAGSTSFLMSSADWQTVQCYVEAGIRLPTTADAAKITLGLSDEDATSFADMWTAYKSVHDHCKDFQDNVYPGTVSLAAAISDYGNNQAPNVFGAFVDIADQVQAKTLSDSDAQAQIKQLVDYLISDAADKQTQVDDAKKKIQDFIDDTTADQGLLTPIKDAYKKKYDGETGLIAQYQQEVQDDQDLIDQYNKEYRQDVTIACTTATYAWVVPLGTVAAAVVAGVYGKKAQDALDHVHEYEDKLDAADAKLQAAIKLKQDLDLADKSLDGILTALNAALPILDSVKGLWGALSDDLTALGKTLAKGIAKAPMPALLRASTKAAIGEWAKLAKDADNYRLNAYAVVKDAADIKSEVKADPDRYAIARQAA